ncbi:MAG TPA: C25 family cysteine peptidase [Candidatus Latescibacteria bacterium]|nr:C25 family cysteine peptidase [Candidatus Latescibacterota bacterium]HOS63338.1 C25 family cysteine peptidase [Candidatus Latescibacterota bacterium]HPK74479.1 C25 family cysteine peptidase [Candidatus Latescibacterota bacterium]
MPERLFPWVMLLILFFSPPSRGEVKVLNSDAHGLDVEITAPLEIDGANPAKLRIPGWETTSDPSQPGVPYLVVPIVVPSEGAVSASVTAQIDTFARCGPVEKGSGDRPIGLDDEVAGAAAWSDPGRQLVSIEITGVARDVRMARLVVCPVSVVEGGVRWTKSLRVAVRFATESTVPLARAARQDTDHPAVGALNADFIPLFRRTGTTQPAERVAASQNSYRVRFYVRYEGIYRITGADLKKWTQGSPIIWETVDPRTFRLEESGREIPIYVEGEERGVVEDSLAIEFFARPNIGRYQSVAPDLYRDPFVEMGIYNLSWGHGPGARLADEDGSLTTPSSSPDLVQCVTYWHTVHAEEDQTFERFGGANEDLIDRYMWKRIGHGDTAEFPIQLESPVNDAKNPPIVEVMARGATFSRHIMEVRLQGTRIGTAGLSPILRDLDLIHFRRSSTAVELEDGVNTLSVITGDPSNPDPNGNDVVALNWFEVTYERNYVAKDNSISFRRPSEPSQGVFEFSLSGFGTPDITVYKVGVSRIRNFTIEAPVTSRSEGYTIRFQDRIDGDDPRYIAVASSRKLKPDRVVVVPVWERPLTDRTRAADYLIVTHSVLMDSVARFAEYRRSAQGGSHTVTVVDVAQIYDEFGYGYPAAEPVRDFLNYAFRYWAQPSLRYVVLVGDGVMRYPSDNMGLLAYPLIPAFLEAQAKWGGTETDHPYAMLAGDDLLPDIIVGRIPASTTNDLRVAVDKIIEFEQTPERSKWRNSVLLISEGEAWFVAQHEFLGAELPPSYFQNKLYNGATTAPHLDVFYGRRGESLALLNEGSLWTIYLGHGGGGVWGSDRLLVHADPPTLQNAGRAGIFLSMTCFTGAFAGVTQKSLAELMLFSRGGAIAWLGASSVGWVNNDFYFTQSIIRAAFAQSRERQTLGSIIAAAKTDYLMRYGGGNADRGSIPHSIVHEYNLIGDPGLQITPPVNRAVLVPNVRTPALAQQITVSGSLPQPINGTATVALVDDYQFEVAPGTQVPVSGGTFSAVFNAPNSLVGTGLTLKTYVAPTTTGSSTDWAGYARMAVADILVDSVIVERTQPDSFYISSTVYGTAGIQAVVCSLVVNSAGTYDNVPMLRVGSSSWFRTVRALDITGIPSDDLYAFAQPVIKAVDGNGKVTIRRDIAPIYPNARAALRVVSAELVGASRGELGVTIANRGTIPSDSVIAKAWVFDDDGVRTLLSETRLTPLASQTNPISDAGDVTIAKPTATQGSGDEILPQYARASFWLPDSLLRGQSPGKRILVAAEAADGRAARDSTMFTVPASVGVYSSASQYALRVVVPSGKFSAEVAPGTFAAETLVTVSQTTAPAKTTQPDVDPPGAKAGRLADACEVKWLAPVVPSPGASLALTLHLDKNDTDAMSALAQGRLRVAYWNANQQQWELIDQQYHTWASDSSATTVPADRAGIYAFVIVDDTTPPDIEISARGQQFGEGAYVNPFTKFVALLEDRNGIATGPGAVKVWLDDVALPDSLITFPVQVASATALPVTITPPLLTPREAPYRLRVSARDAAGNVGESTVNFRVAGQTLVDFYGNFPNPFGAQGTIFAFSFSAQISEVTFRIYDLAGRLVLKFSNYDLSALYPDDSPSLHQSTSPYRLLDRNGLPLVAPSYHELEWSGRNARGEFLANGVYFGIITVRDEAGDEVAKRIFKMVKAE